MNIEQMMKLAPEKVEKKKVEIVSVEPVGYSTGLSWKVLAKDGTRLLETVWHSFQTPSDEEIQKDFRSGMSSLSEVMA